MMRKALALSLGLLAVGLGDARADIGPKPTETFKIDVGLSGLKPTEGSAVLMQCEREDCADAKPLERVGPQHFSCGAGSCEALAYGFGPYQKLVLAFSDGKTRESPVFHRSRALDASFAVKVEADKLALRDITPADAALPARVDMGDPSPSSGLGRTSLSRFEKAFYLTLAIELTIAALFALSRRGMSSKRRVRLVATVAAANLISVPSVWFVLPLLVRSVLRQELLVWAFEAAFIYVLNRGSMSKRTACLLSLAMNLASSVAGLFLVI